MNDGIWIINEYKKWIISNEKKQNSGDEEFFKTAWNWINIQK